MLIMLYIYICTFQNECPTLSIDANFGLCRKVAAGTSVRDPLHTATGLYCDQQSVDVYVSNYGRVHESNQEVFQLPAQ